ncbi:MAG: glutamine amidotransferase-related protein [Myxococcaceae bacterium]
MSRRAVVFIHEAHEGPGLLKGALEKSGYVLEERQREVREGDADADLVVVMGGPMGVYEADRYPFVKAEIELVRARLAANKPVIGICLGAQILAAAAGSRVYPGKEGVELGVFPVMLTGAGRNDPAFGGNAQTLEVAHWHGDTFDPVPGATLLASSDRYPQQAFKTGRSYGVQFHPELDVETFARWLDNDPDAVHSAGRYIEEIRQDDLPKLKKAVPAWQTFLERLVEAASLESTSALP